jgi:hypothetical protein
MTEEGGAGLRLNAVVNGTDFTGHAPFSTERRIRGRYKFCVVGNPGTLRSR